MYSYSMAIGSCFLLYHVASAMDYTMDLVEYTWQYVCTVTLHPHITMITSFDEAPVMSRARDAWFASCFHTIISRPTSVFVPILNI